MGNQFAAGKKAFGFCDICSFRYPLKQLRNLTVKTKQTETKACPQCWTPDQPQLQLGMYPVYDPQALRNPRPDFSYPQSREALVPVYNFINADAYTTMEMAIGTVTVSTT